MEKRRSVRALFPAVLLAGWAISSAFPFSSFAQGDRAVRGAAPAIEILAPASGAQIPPGKVLVIGRVKVGAFRSVEVDVNGKVHHSALASNGGFMASVYLMKGRNVLTVHADGASVERSVVASDTVTYRYHPEVEKCAGCHGDTARGYLVTGRQDTVCYQCHDRKDGKKLVHGPLGGGECTSCHDPHGAMNVSLTVASAEGLCVRCHDQPHSAKHMRESKAVGCVTCHEPHSSSKLFLQK
jgi:predicted CXXCH cytochrome family protein